MKKSVIALVLACILIFGCSCSCGKNNFADNLMVSTSPTEIASDSDISETDSESVSETVVSVTDSTESEITESTQVSVSTSDVTETDISSTTITTKASSTTASTASSDGKNAPGVHKPNYKTKYYIVVHTGSQSVAIYGKDSDGYYNELVKCFTCSTGTKGHETRTGSYTIWRKFRWRALVGGVYGQYNSSISKDYLFHSVPYLKKSVDALDTPEYDKLGSPASHGCIRLCVRDSKWIYDNCDIDTQVYITNTSGPAGASIPQRNTDSEYNGWDPSDKWAKHNPYFYSPSTAATTTTTTTTATTVSTTAAVTESESVTTSAATTSAATTSTEVTTATTAASESSEDDNA